MSLTDCQGRSYASTDAWLEEVRTRSRNDHPDRYAPDGTPLADQWGNDWEQRMRSWDAQQVLAEAIAEEQAEPSDEPPIPDADDLDIVGEGIDSSEVPAAVSGFAPSWERPQVTHEVSS